MNSSIEALALRRCRPRPGAGAARGRILIALLAACALHAGAGWVLWPGVSQGLPTATHPQDPAPVRVRLMSAPAVDLALAAGGAPAAPLAPPPVPAEAPPPASPPAPVAEPAAAPAPAAAPQATKDAAAPALPAVQPDLPMVEGYVLRRALTRAPVPLAEVVPAWPEGLAPNETQLGRFTLFINEDGGVDRIVPDGPSLFPALEASAVAAFSAARFRPGEVEGRQVRSLIRIEVVFEPRATSVPGAVVVSRQNL